MPRNAKLTDEERMSAVQEYLDGKGTLPGIAQKYGVSYTFDYSNFRISWRSPIFQS